MICVVIRRSSDTEIDSNIFQAPSLAFGDLAGGPWRDLRATGSGNVLS